MNAAIIALPSTDPSCRVALYTPEPAPAMSGGSLRVAVAASGDQMNAIPTPSAMNGSTSRQTGVVGVISTDSQVNPIARVANPNPTTGTGCERSMIRPTHGASRPLVSAIGAVSTAEPVGLRPITCCA